MNPDMGDSMSEPTATANPVDTTPTSTATTGAGVTTVTVQPTPEPDKGFPENTPVQEMTDSQKVAYWQHQSRRWEGRAKERGDYDDLKAKADQFDEYKRQQMSEHEKAVEAARNEGRTIALKEANEGAVKAILKANLTARGKSPEEADEILSALSPSAFVNDDGPDADKVTAFVTRIAGEIQAQHQQVDLGQGPRSGGPKSEEDTVYEALYGSGR